MNGMGAPAFDAQELHSQMQPLFARLFSDDLEHVYAQVDRLCLQLCFRVARECDLLSSRTETLTQIVARANIAPDAVYLVGTVLDILCEEGLVRRTAIGYEGLKPCPRDESEQLRRCARSAHGDAMPIFELIARCHESAIEFVSGRKTGLAVVFAHGDMELWTRVHTVDRVMSIYADFIAPALEASAPPGMRALEVGGGVGAVLRRCLPVLERLEFDHYCFTDLGQSFVQNAQHAYGSDRRLSFARVDLDWPLSDQGLALESFDLVVAVNALHAAKHLLFSLEQLRDVLKPDGCLILSEGSPPDPSRRWRLDVVFAFLRGWWDVSTDARWRPNPGFLLPRQWKKALLACGYDAVRLLPGEDWFRGPCRGGIILARKSSVRASGRVRCPI
jgi:SAM-dependent methyltransferase